MATPVKKLESTFELLKCYGQREGEGEGGGRERPVFHALVRVTFEDTVQVRVQVKNGSKMPRQRETVRGSGRGRGKSEDVILLETRRAHFRSKPAYAAGVLAVTLPTGVLGWRFQNARRSAAYGTKHLTSPLDF